MILTLAGALVVVLALVIGLNVGRAYASGS
jgi:hypothetical protein